MSGFPFNGFPSSVTDPPIGINDVLGGGEPLVAAL